MQYQVEDVLARAFPEPINETFFLGVHGWLRLPNGKWSHEGEFYIEHATQDEAIEACRDVDRCWCEEAIQESSTVLYSLSSMYRWFCAHPERFLPGQKYPFLEMEAWAEINVPPLFPSGGTVVGR